MDGQSQFLLFGDKAEKKKDLKCCAYQQIKDHTIPDTKKVTMDL